MRQIMSLAALLISVVAAGISGCSNTVDNGGGPGPGNGTHNGEIALHVTANQAADIRIGEFTSPDGEFSLPVGGPYTIDAFADGFDHPPCDIEVSGDTATVSIYHAAAWAEIANKPEQETFEVPNNGSFQVTLNPLWENKRLDCYVVVDGTQYPIWDGPVTSTLGGEAVSGFGGGSTLYRVGDRFVGGNASTSWNLTMDSDHTMLEGTWWDEDIGEQPYICWVD